MLCKINLSGKIDTGLNNVTIYDIMMKDRDLQNLSKVGLHAYLHIYTMEKVILNIFLEIYWPGKKMQNERF